MRRVLLAAALCVGVVGCGDRSTGGGDHHQGCSGPGTCTTGNYCALTDDGNVCWPDVVAPDVRGVVVECSTSPCRRDAVLVVTATVEDESATGRAWVELDVDPGTRWEMAAVSGSTFRAEVALDRGPFPFFEHDVHPAVHAIDEAGNWASTEAGLPVAVTRARWTTALESGTALAALFARRFSRTADRLVEADGQALLRGERWGADTEAVFRWQARLQRTAERGERCDLGGGAGWEPTQGDSTTELS